MESYIHAHKTALIRILVIIMALLFRGLKLNEGMAPFDFASLFAALAGSYPTFEKAMDGIKKRHFNFYLLGSLLILGTLCFGKFSLALVISLASIFIINIKHPHFSKKSRITRSYMK